MGRFLKKASIKAADSALQIPFGPTAVRPTTASDGMLRYNTSTGRLEVFYSSAWNSVAKIGNVTITKDSFTGNGAGNTFVMSIAETDGNAIVAYVGNVHQNPGVAYTLFGNTWIQFTSTPGNGVPIEVFHKYNSTDAA